MYRRYKLIALSIISLLILTLLPTTSATAAPTIASPFRDYYAEHQGWRVLGAPLTQMIEVEGVSAQLFEKGRLEDHRGLVDDPHWAFMYGRLTAELMVRAPNRTVNATNVTYAQLKAAAEPGNRHAAPDGFANGTRAVVNGIFVPYDAQLQAAPGYVVPLYFWSYINQAELFPGGWLHDIGLPMTAAFLVDTVKDGNSRQIMLQAFERTMLTYDPQNPRAWQVERGNIGTDAQNTPRTRTTIELPAPNAQVTLPLHIVARVGQPNEQIMIALRWQNGVTLSRTTTVLRDSDGSGLVLTSLDWRTESRPPQPAAHATTLEIRATTGEIHAQQPLQVLRWDDPGTQAINVYWLLGDRIHPSQQPVLRTLRIGTAALEALLWGPRPGNLAGFSTAIPSPEEVLAYPGRTTTWGPRVTLRKLTINDGVATANFSQELLAFGGDAERAAQIKAQIRQTLLQFPSVRDVRILIEGQEVPALAP